MPVGFASADAASAEVTGGAWRWDFGAQRRGDNANASGIWFQESSENELGSSVCRSGRWDLVHRGAAITRAGVIRVAVGLVARMLLRMQPAWR